MTFSSDGRYLAAGGKDGRAYVWDVDRKSLAVELIHPASVVAVRFGPDRKRLITGALDRAARIWGLPTGRELLRIDHAESVDDAMTTADGQYLTTLSGEHVMRHTLDLGTLAAEACRRMSRELSDVEWAQRFQGSPRALCRGRSRD